MYVFQEKPLLWISRPEIDDAITLLILICSDLEGYEKIYFIKLLRERNAFVLGIPEKWDPGP